MIPPWSIAATECKWFLYWLLLLLLTLWLAAGWSGVAKRRSKSLKRKWTQKEKDELEWLKRMNNKMKE